MRTSGVALFVGIVMGVVAMSAACSSAKGTECTKLAACCASDATCKKVADNGVENDCKTTQVLYCSAGATCSSVCAKVCPAQKATCEASCATVPASCKTLLDSAIACLDKASDAKCDMGNPIAPSCQAKIDAVSNCANPPGDAGAD
jgi:hypothetical protein